MIPGCDEATLQKLSRAPYLWLFLDYDGTLSDFARTPDEIVPDKELIALIERLAGHAEIRITIISGRRLDHILALLPVRRIFRAGSYGLELMLPDGETVYQVEYGSIRPLLVELKRFWKQLLSGREGFYLEDKGWTLAIHGKDALEEEALIVFREARLLARALLEQDADDLFRLQGGHRFLECSPHSGDKKRTVEFLISTYGWHEEARLAYFGDDDKDEVAFEAIQQREGVAIAVGDRLRESSADCWLPSPQATRSWLSALLEAREATT